MNASVWSVACQLMPWLHACAVTISPADPAYPAQRPPHLPMPGSTGRSADEKAPPRMLQSRKLGKQKQFWPSSSACDAHIAHGPGRVMNSEAVVAWAAANRTLLHYLYPPARPASVRDGWEALTDGCQIEPLGCWCFHVAGSMVKSRDKMRDMPRLLS